MFHRFAAGSAIGAMAIALAGLILVSLSGAALYRTWPLTVLWCFVPLAWGVWAMLTPRAWLPQHLPIWGAILGFLGGVMGAVVLNLPSRILEVRVAFAGRLLAVAVMTVVYYFLWMVVRTAYQFLVPAPRATQVSAAGPQLKKAA